MTLADVPPAGFPWSTFWSAMQGVGTVAAIAAAAYVSYRVTFPKRRLFYGMPSVAALLGGAPSSARAELEVRRRSDNRVLSHPHVVQVHLTTRGRKDIPSAAYDNGMPIVLGVGGEIIDVLAVTAEPTSPACPPYEVAGSDLRIGPGLLGKRQRITFTLLLDSNAPAPTCSSKLIDVEPPRRQDQPPPPWWGRRPWVVLIFLASVAMGVAANWATAVAGWATIGGGALVFLVTAALTMTSIWRRQPP
jgi:hypothetical protein